MNTDWIEYKCKSGDTLFIYNKVTGEHKWPTSNSTYDSSSPVGSVMLGQPLTYKEFSSIGTQTDDNFCNNGCTSMFVDTNHVSYKNPEISPHPKPCFENRVTKELADDTLDQKNGLRNDVELPEEQEKKKKSAISAVVKHLKERRRMVRSINNVNKSRKLNHMITTPIYDKNIGSSINHLEGPNINTARFAQIQKPTLQIYHEMVHQRDVSELKPFKCSWCNKRFPRKGSLKRHISIHKGERPFQCSYCKREFRHKHHLIKHLKGIHGVYKCSYCERDFADESALKSHLC